MLVGAGGVRRSSFSVGAASLCRERGGVGRQLPDHPVQPGSRGVAGMSEEHERLVAEFRALAETVLARLEPVLQKAAAATADVASDSASTDTQPVFWLQLVPGVRPRALVRGRAPGCWHSSRVKQRHSLRCFVRFSTSFSGDQVPIVDRTAVRRRQVQERTRTAALSRST